MNEFSPVAQGINEVMLFPGGIDQQQKASILSKEDLASLYSSEPFRRCDFCKESYGFLWMPAFTAHARHFHLFLVTARGRTIYKTPRPMCGSCLTAMDDESTGARIFGHDGP